MTRCSPWIAALFSSVILCILRTSTAYSLPVEEVSGLDHRDLDNRQIPGKYFPVDIYWNSTTISLYANVDIGNETVKLELSNWVQTWAALRWNATTDCVPLDECNRIYPYCYMKDAFHCNNGRQSGLLLENGNVSSSYTNIGGGSGYYRTKIDDYTYGQWVKGSMTVGSAKVDNFIFGISQNYRFAPTLGLGKRQEYHKQSTFLEELVNQKSINTVSYGIYCGDSKTGDNGDKSLVIGGIDVAKFQRPLRTYSAIVSDIGLRGVKVISAGQTVKTPLGKATGSGMRAELNYSSDILYLPRKLYDDAVAVLKQIADVSDKGDKYWGPDPILSVKLDSPSESEILETSGLEFEFDDDLKIFVSFLSMVQMNPVHDINGYKTFSMAKNSDEVDEAVLGMPFFRNAYVFFDHTNNEISIAASILNQTTHDIREVGAGNSSVRALKLYELEQVEELQPPQQQLQEERPVTLIAVGAAAGGVLLIVIVLFVWYIGRDRWAWKSAPKAPEAVDYPYELEGKTNILEVPYRPVKNVHTVRVEIDGSEKPAELE